MGYDPIAIPSNLPTSPIPAVEERVKNLQRIREEAIACHNIAMQRMKERGSNSRFKPWKPGDKVWLSGAHLLIPFPSKKLAPKRFGPFTIKSVLSPITYVLNLPKTWKIHSTFHASELSSYQETEVHGPNFHEPPPDVIDNEEEFEIESILSHKKTQGYYQYLISWLGYPSSENTWLPEKALINAKEILKCYKTSHQL
jgi:hypothetical protein